jgi:hypothetical protein
MNRIVKFVIYGWGIEFGKYYCGGAPAGIRRCWIEGGLLVHGQWVFADCPAVPLSWSWGVGIHYRTRWDKVVKPTKECSWVWCRRWWYGKEHQVTS